MIFGDDEYDEILLKKGNNHGYPLVGDNCLFNWIFSIPTRWAGGEGGGHHRCTCMRNRALILWCWFGTYYEINGGQLKIVGGPFRWKIDIMMIMSIRKTRNPLSSPALSLNRLELQYGKWGTILISPKNEEQFCEELKKINSKIDLNL